MSSRTLKVFLGLGIVFGITLLLIRLDSRGPLFGSLDIFEKLLGYEEPITYIIFLFDKEKAPIYIASKVSEGRSTILSIEAASSLIKHLPVSEFPVVAEAAIMNLMTDPQLEQIDIIGFATIDAVRKMAGVLGSLKVDGEPSDALNFVENIREITSGQVITLSKIRLIKETRQLFLAAKEALSEDKFGLYLKKTNLEKSCFGACGNTFTEYAKW